MSFKYIPVSLIREWHYCHCTAKFWGRQVPKHQNQKQSTNFENTLTLLNIKDPIITDEFTIIVNNYEQKTTLCVDNGLFLMGSVDFIVFDKLNYKCFIFIIKKSSKIPKKVYKSDKNLVLIYNLLLFRFIHRKKRNYQVRIGFEFLKNFSFLLEKVTNFKIGNPAICYTSKKKEFIEEFISNPIDFFKKYQNQIFFIPFNFSNLFKVLNNLHEMISECKEPNYIERNHKNSKKCQKCYYNKLFSCENTIV
ncbi:MAG: hypothetical protein ACTSO9_01650 [Candidatus Helarchaeota archaeon]